MKLGLCLSGGGVKAAAHIGAIKALEENKIKFDYFSGTSSGSIVATLYAIGFTPFEMLELFKNYGKKVKYIDFINIINLIISILFKGKIAIKGFNRGKIIEKIINENCEKKKVYNIKDINKPLIIPSIDVNTGDINMFTSRKTRKKYSDNIIYIDDCKIGKVVRASCSYPIIFEPCECCGKQLIDGGIRENVPWKETKKIGAEKVLSIIFEENKNNRVCKNLFDVASNSLEILCDELSNYELEGAEYLLKIKTENVMLLDYKKIDYLYWEGYNQTKSKIENIKREILK